MKNKHFHDKRCPFLDAWYLVTGEIKEDFDFITFFRRHPEALLQVELIRGKLGGIRPFCRPRSGFNKQKAIFKRGTKRGTRIDRHSGVKKFLQLFSNLVDKEVMNFSPLNQANIALRTIIFIGRITFSDKIMAKIF